MDGFPWTSLFVATYLAGVVVVAGMVLVSTLRLIRLRRTAQSQAGASSLVRISPERGAVLVIMTNLEDAPLGEIANAIAAVVLGPSR